MPSLHFYNFCINFLLFLVDVAVGCKQAVLILLSPDDLCGLSLGIISNTSSWVLDVRSGRKLGDNAVAAKEDSEVLYWGGPAALMK